MLTTINEQLDDLLTKAADAMDIPTQAYEDAMVKYEDVGTWLAEEDSALRCYSPEIYPQGSFRLGTVVRPISDSDEYDIDLVCHLELHKDQTTQNQLKQVVGDRLKRRADLAKIIEPSRRCWILDYPPEAQLPRFHMDILPAIQNRERPPTGILLTDTELTLWQRSNPKAYAEWFYDRMKVILLEKRTALAKSIQASIEDVPEWQVKTPLQRAIQILKRHRDIHFQNNLENRPASIIITTLAAHAYRNQESLRDALIQIAPEMPRYIEKRSGKWWVANPVDPDENFADKWNEYPERLEAFNRWLIKVGEDLSGSSQKQTLSKAVDLLVPILGEQTMTRVARDLGLQSSLALPVPTTSQVQIPALGDTRHCQLPAWPIKNYYKASVTGSVHMKNGGKKLWSLASRPVQKRLWLRFAASTNTPPPYDVRWQVVNTGKDAVEARQLRGDFYESDVPGKSVRWESTLYKGTHWIEAFIIKNGDCLARSGRKIVKVR